MTGVKMYNTLLDIFQGLEHDEDTVKIEVDDGTGRASKPFSNAMLPNLLCAKVDQASFNTWNALPEKYREDWPTIQVSFLRAAKKNLTTHHDASSKFRTANQRSEGSKGLTEKEKKLYKDACEKGKRMHNNIWKKLTKEEKNELIKLKREKYNAQNNGGLGFQ
eukprot:12365010-Ditylum_brightwellii.AAC.1